MIPKIIHYCWFGKGEMPDLEKRCIESWHRYMPDWEYRLWNEDNFDINAIPYTKEAYQAKKYAFVSDYVRLWVLEQFGGLYMDVDFEIFKTFDDILQYNAFAGFEGSKHKPVMMGVIASVPHGTWIKEQLDSYANRHFVFSDGSLDMTTNVTFITGNMIKQGFIPNGKEQDYKDLHIFPTDYFCPRQTTGEYLKTENTYCDHLGACSWNTSQKTWKTTLRNIIGQTNMTRLIKLKRKFEK